MKNLYLKIVVLFSILIISTSCSSTWSGVKDDSNDAWGSTKEVSTDAWKSTKKGIHDATAE